MNLECNYAVLCEEAPSTSKNWQRIQIVKNVLLCSTEINSNINDAFQIASKLRSLGSIKSHCCTAIATKKDYNISAFLVYKIYNISIRPIGYYH